MNPQPITHLKCTFMKNAVYDLTISSAFGRNTIYADQIDSKIKGKFKAKIREILNALEPKYTKRVSAEEYIKDVIYLSKTLSNQYGHILKDGKLRLGASQKLLSLYLKHLWALDLIKEPPLCPFDGIIIQRLGLNHKWTQLDSVKAFKELVAAVSIRCKEDGFGNNISLWEMSTYEQVR